MVENRNYTKEPHSVSEKESKTSPLIATATMRGKTKREKTTEERHGEKQESKRESERERERERERKTEGE